LLLALEAGKKAGGDIRGERSAALLAASKIRGSLNLRVDNHEDPIKELKQLLKKSIADSHYDKQNFAHQI